MTITEEQSFVRGMIRHLNKISRPVIPQDITFGPITPIHLLSSAPGRYGIRGLLEDTNYPSYSVFDTWASGLQLTHSWLPRQLIATSGRMELAHLLILAYDECNKARPNHKNEGGIRMKVPTPTTPLADKSCPEFLSEYIANYSTPCGLGKSDVSAVVLRQAAVEANFYGFDGTTAQAHDDDYIDWAACLKKREIADRKPPLVELLRDGRKHWVQLKIGGADNGSASARVPRMASFFSEIEIEDDDNEDLHDPSTQVSCQCDFCGKESQIYHRSSVLLAQLTKGSQFFCPFCVRHDLHTRKRNNVLVFTMRAMIGYLYYTCYFGKAPRLYLSQLEDMVENHVQIGKLNPLFVYDRESFCWFVDFSKVGHTKHKIAVNEVLHTVLEMITAFNPYENIKDFKGHKYAQRFVVAVNDFYHRRYRPNDKLICAPTLVQCASETRDGGKGANANKKLDVAAFRHFTPCRLRYHKSR